MVSLSPCILGNTPSHRPQPFVLKMCQNRRLPRLRHALVRPIFVPLVSGSFVSVFLFARRVSVRVLRSPGPVFRVFSSPLFSLCHCGKTVRRLPCEVCLPRAPRWRQVPKELRTSRTLLENEICRSLTETEKLSLPPLGQRG